MSEVVEICPDGLLPDGAECPRCGMQRAPSGTGGGVWVHVQNAPVIERRQVLHPAAKEVWLVVDANGIPSGPADGDEATAHVTAKTLDERVPQYGPHRVQKYVVEDRLTFTQEWYAARHERLSQLVRKEATPEFKQHWFSVIGNGTAEAHEPPTYAQLLNTKQHTIDRMAHHIATLHQLLGLRPSTEPRAEVEKLAERLLKELVSGGRLLAERNREWFDRARSTAGENERLRAELDGAQRALEATLTPFPPDTDVRSVLSAIIGVCEHEDGPTVVRYIGQLERLLKEARAHAGEDVPKRDGA
jgi:hypothetical protein